MNNDFSNYEIAIDERALAYEALDRLVKTLVISLAPQESRQQIKNFLLCLKSMESARQEQS